jgi:hypothetical protein
VRASQMLHDLEKSIWLGNVKRRLLTTGTLLRYIDDPSATGRHRGNSRGREMEDWPRAGISLESRWITRATN